MKKTKRTTPAQSVQREHQWAVRELVARYCLLAQAMAAEIEQQSTARLPSPHRGS